MLGLPAALPAAQASVDRVVDRVLVALGAELQTVEIGVRTSLFAKFRHCAASSEAPHLGERACPFTGEFDSRLTAQRTAALVLTLAGLRRQGSFQIAIRRAN